MTNRRRRIALLVVLAVLTAGCPIETSRQSPAILNSSDHAIWFQTIARDLGDGRAGATRVDPRETVPVDGHTDPCLSFDTLRITANNPSESAEPEILLEHDLSAQPICERQTWVFDGETLERAL